jgi:hypothetical protein
MEPLPSSDALCGDRIHALTASSGRWGSRPAGVGQKATTTSRRWAEQRVRSRFRLTELPRHAPVKGRSPHARCGWKPIMAAAGTAAILEGLRRIVPQSSSVRDTRIKGCT